MNVLKDLTRQVAQPVPNSADRASTAIKVILFLAAAFFAFQIAISFGMRA